MLFGIVFIWGVLAMLVRCIQLRGLPSKMVPMYWAHSTKIVSCLLIVVLEFATFCVRFFANDYSIALYQGIFYWMMVALFVRRSRDLLIVRSFNRENERAIERDIDRYLTERVGVDVCRP